MIVLYDTNYTHNSNAYLANSVLEGARVAFAGEEVLLAGNEDLMRLAASARGRVLICMDGQRLRTDIIGRIRHCFDITILWVFEDPFMLESNQNVAHLFDYVFTNDPECAGTYGGKGRYMPLGGSRAQDFRPVRNDHELEFDIFFAGTMWPNRTLVIERLIKRFGDRRLKLVCPTNEYLPPLPGAIAERSIDHPVDHASFIDFANRSKVVLTLYRDYTSGGGLSKANAPGPRYFETALAGAPQIIAVDPGASSLYFDTIPGNRLCRSTEEVFAAIDGILKDPIDRDRRAKNSQQVALQRHLYEHRLGTMVEAIRRPSSREAPADREDRRRVIFCTHSVKTAQHIGGIEIYQDLLGGMLGDEIELFYWVRGADRCQLLDRNLSPIENFTAPAIGWLDILSDPHEESLFSATLTSYSIDVVHFHHLGHHSASLPIVAKALGMGVVFSAHDFFLVCSRYNLLDYQLRYCNIASRSILACDSCLRIGEGLHLGAQQTRRAFMSRVVDSLDVVLFGTQSSKDVMQRIFPRLGDDRCEILGVSNNHLAIAPNRAAGANSKTLNIAVLGNVLRSKGADCLLRIIELLRASDDYVFHIFGRSEEAYREVFHRLAGPTVRFYDGYRNADVDSLAACDVALFLSNWPETFSLSLSEAWQAGMIPIASNIGAFADRIEDHVNGFLVPVDDEASVVALLQRLKTKPEIYRSMQASLTPALWPDKEEHVERLRALYKALAPKVAFTNNSVKIDIGQIGLLPQSSWKVQAPPRHILEAETPNVYRLSSEFLDKELVYGNSMFYLDGIGGHVPEEKVGGTSLPLQFAGWSFAVSEALAGRLQLGLIGEAQSIFLDCERQIRDDVCILHPQAPEFSGFMTLVRLQGKWSDGLYKIILLNNVGKKTFVVYLPWSCRLADGAISEVSLTENNSAYERFIKARLCGLPAEIPSAQDPLALPENEADPMATLEEVRRVVNGCTTAYLRGWFFHPAMDAEAAHLYIGVGRCGHVELRRVARRDRADVRDALAIAELRTGFREEIVISPDASDLEVHLLWCDGRSHSRVRFTASVGGDAGVKISRLARASEIAARSEIDTSKTETRKRLSFPAIFHMW